MPFAGALIASHKAGVPIALTHLEVHVLAGGDPADLARAGITLGTAGTDPDYALLSSVSLREGRGVDVAKAFVAARQLHPDLVFAEVADRYLNGEDVIGAAQQNDLRPSAGMKGWSVRLEYGPVDPDRVKELVQKVPDGVTVLLRKPGSNEWVAPDRYIHLLS